MQLAKTLSALALLGAAVPSTYALSIKDDKVSLGVGLRIQTRATMATADDAAGNDYRVQGGISNAKNDPLDFQIRRSRINLGIKYGDNWSGNFALSADGIDAAGHNQGRGVQVRYANVRRTFKGDSISHMVDFGLQKPENNPESMDSSSRMLFPTGVAADAYLAPRGVGIGYRLQASLLRFSVDLMNNQVAKDTSTVDSADEAEGFFFGARVEFSFSPEWYLKRRSGSYLGKEGKGWNFGLAYGVNDNGVGAASTVATSAYGIDTIFWYNNISAMAGARFRNTETSPYAGGSTDVDSETFWLQVGYAIPLESGLIIEPAVRFQLIDNNTDADESSVYGNNSETGGSGTTIDLGATVYIDNHNNKLQFNLQLWEAEEGDGGATIFRVQHMLTF